MARHYSEAVDKLRRAIVLDPSRNTPYNLMARALSLQGKFDEALTVFDESTKKGRPTGGPQWLTCVEVRAGRPNEAVALLREILAGTQPARRLAVAYACVGDEEHAVAFLEKAVTQHEPGVAEILRAPELSSMRSPRLETLRSSVNMR